MTKKNDIRRLKEEADIRTVVDYCGIRKGRRIGGAQFVICPNPGHDDVHPTNAYYRDGWNTIYCTTCQKNMGAVDILMWTRGLSYGEAADILWELEGRPDWYYAKPERGNGKKEFYISPSELEVLGLHFPSTIRIPVRQSGYKEHVRSEMPDKCAYRFTGEGYIMEKLVPSTWEDFLSPSEMAKLVLSKGKERLSAFDEVEQKMGMKNLFPEERKRVTELLSRAKERGCA